jgi:hypothetical protein
MSIHLDTITIQIPIFCLLFSLSLAPLKPNHHTYDSACSTGFGRQAAYATTSALLAGPALAAYLRHRAHRHASRVEPFGGVKKASMAIRYGVEEGGESPSQISEWMFVTWYS